MRVLLAHTTLIYGANILFFISLLAISVECVDSTVKEIDKFLRGYF